MPNYEFHYLLINTVEVKKNSPLLLGCLIRSASVEKNGIVPLSMNEGMITFASKL